MKKWQIILCGGLAAVVLAGGGARGLAHLGVIKYMEELGIPVYTLNDRAIGGKLDLAIDGPEVHLLVFQTKDDVLGCREDIHKVIVLMDHSDSQRVGILGGADGNLPAILEDLTAIRLVDAGEHVHQCSLTASVLTQKAEDFSSVDLEIDLVVGDNGAEGLPDVPQFNCAIGLHLLSSLYRIW